MKWIRLWVDEVVKGTTFDELNLAERGLWWSLLLLAGDSLNPGIVEIRKEVAFTHETLASVVNCDRKILRKYIKKLISVGKIAQLKDGRLQIVNWKKYQTRYEKYYKNNNDDGGKDGIQSGIPMPGRLEGEVEEEVDIKNPPQTPGDFFSQSQSQLVERYCKTLGTHFKKKFWPWVQTQIKNRYRADVIVWALGQLWEYRESTKDPWPYLNHILVIEDQNTTEREHMAKHEKLKQEETDGRTPAFFK